MVAYLYIPAYDKAHSKIDSVGQEQSCSTK